MERSLITTGDGSSSIFVPHLNEHYHSIHGAVQESAHVFLKMGLDLFLPQSEPIQILEIGLGTGLNALMTLAAADEQVIHYTAIEKYPVEQALWSAVNYTKMLNRPDLAETFTLLHTADWNSPFSLSPTFQLLKLQGEIESFEPGQDFHLIYFDAFAPEKQPELWTQVIFDKMFRLLKPGGALVTYCAKGVVRRTMIAAGFRVEKLPGPPGKREMLRAHRDD